MPGTVQVARGWICADCRRPVEMSDSGERRCTPCRSRERADQLARQRAREDAATRRASRIDVARRKAERPETFGDGEMTEDDLRALVEADGPDSVDLGDPWDWALAERIGALPPVPVSDLVEADRLWTTGEARRVLKRTIGISAYADAIGVSRRAVHTWAAGQGRPRGAHRNRAAHALLLEKAAAEHDDAILVAHGLEPTKANMRQLERDHAETWQTDDPWNHCTGCAQYRRSQRRRY